jgi:hypothetical protein
MAARRVYTEDFYGDGATTIPTTATLFSPWRKTVTAAAGTPTCVFGYDNGSSAGAAGILRLKHTSNTQVENICLSHGDVLSHSIGDKLLWKGRLRFGQAALDTTTSVFFGLAGDRNDAIASIAVRAGFTLVASVSTTIVYCVTDDGTTDSGNISTGVTLTTGWKDFEIRLSDKSNVLFYMTDNNSVLARVAAGTTFSMSAYSGCFQPYFQLQKTSDNNEDELQCDYTDIFRSVIG